MYRFYLGLFLLFYSFIELSAQQIGTYSIYRDQFQMINPAALNHLNLTSSKLEGNYINTAYRSQWIGTEGAPTSFNFTFENFIEDKNFKWGIFFRDEEVFATSDYSFFGNAAYIFNLVKGRDKEKKIAIGINMGFVFQSFDLDKISFADPSETFTNENKLFANVALGAFYISGNKGPNSGKKFYAGLSTLQLYSQQININASAPDLNTNDRVIHVYGIAGGVIQLANGVLEPSIWLRTVSNSTFLSLTPKGSPLSGNVNIRYQIFDPDGRKKVNRKNIRGFWFGFGAGTTKELNIELGAILYDENGGGSKKLYRFGIAAVSYLAQQFNLGPTLELTFSASF